MIKLNEALNDKRNFGDDEKLLRMKIENLENEIKEFKNNINRIIFFFLLILR